MIGFNTIEDLRLQEDKEFNDCRTVTDYDNFIKKYEAMAPNYQASHLDEARQKRDALLSKQQKEALEKAQENERIKIETEKRKRIKRRMIKYVLGLLGFAILVVAIVLLALSYHPVKYVSVNNLEFDKYGGVKELLIKTNVNGRAVDIEYDHADWLTFIREENENAVSVTAAVNPLSEERSGKVIVKAYPVFNGHRIESHPTTVEVLVKQQPSDNLLFTVNGAQFVMVAVEGGTFDMGSQDGEENEKPVHKVTLSDYYIGETEVTQELWEAVTGITQRVQRRGKLYGIGGDLPVYYVSYDDIVDKFLPKLNQLTGQKFRLPTEAEWEYAALGGIKSQGNAYSGGTWKFEDNYNPVKSEKPNELGIYDMSCSVWEWCSDTSYDYSSLTQTNPSYIGGDYFVRRGGFSISIPIYIGNKPEGSHTYVGTASRVKDRAFDKHGSHYCYLGFRLALSK